MPNKIVVGRLRKACMFGVEIDDEVIDFELEIEPSRVMRTEDYYLDAPDANTFVLAYLADDPDCENPLECCDGVGRVYSEHRRASKEDLDKVREVWGLDNYGEQRWPEYLEQAAEQLQGEGEALAEPSELDVARRAKELWASSLDPFAVSLDCYEHGGQHWSVRDEDMHGRWGMARGDGVWVPDTSCREHIESFPKEQQRAKAEECAKQALEEYNLWLAGECFGIVAERHVRTATGWGREAQEACWGFVGTKAALEEMLDFAGCV